MSSADMAARAPVDAVVVTFNSADVIADCLDALVRNGSEVDKVIVVDNQSSDETLSIVRSHPIGPTVIDSGGNLGYSAAINLGVAASGAEAVLILNPDTQVHAGAVAALGDAVGSIEVGIAAPSIVNPDGSLERSIRRFPTALRLLGQSILGATRAGRYEQLGDLVVDPQTYARAGFHDWVSGAALIVHRRCIDDVGPWDESFFLYSEETDYCWRAHKMGHGVLFVPEAVVEHVGGDSKTSARLWSILVRNRVRVVYKHRGRVHGFAYWLVSVFGELIRSARPKNRAALLALLSPWEDPAVRTTRERVH